MAKYIDAEKLIHDLEERIFAYSQGYAEGDDNRKDAIETLLKDVKYQYSLQQEQPEKPVPNDLEEAKEAYCEEHNDDCFDATGDKCPHIRNAFIAGAKWQKQEMLKKAEETELYWDGDFLAIDLNMAALGYSEHDKVRVIVLPNTDEK